MVLMVGHPIFSIEDKVAIVTGSGRGIGEALAVGFAEAGAKVVVNVAHHPDQGQATVDAIQQKGGEAVLVQADVSNQADVERLVDSAVDAFGGLDILVNNAGIVAGGPAEDLDMETWNRVLAVNLTGVYLCCGMAAKKVMIPQKSGRIINIASISAEIGHPGGNPGLQQAAYHAAKGGVNMLTRCLALEWVSYGIVVNTLSPGWIDTGIDDEWFEADPGNLPLVLDDTPMHRLGNPEELVGAAIFLSSDAVSFMTGQNVIVDGGYTSW
jgi:NAD(P)-dependent dehydrogenase (short-subunit alcohol dehydrogenase family)